MFVLAVVVAAGAFVVPRLEGDVPTLVGPSAIILGQIPQLIAIEAGDTGSGLRELRVTVVQGDREETLVSETLRGDPMTGGLPGGFNLSRGVPLDAGQLELEDGEAQLVIAARDWSWRGNEARLEIPITIDTSPPKIENQSTLTYVHRGSGALAAYRTSDDAVRHGVRVGEDFFPGYPRPDGGPGEHVALFAIPVESPAKARVELVAVDEAGNESVRRFPAHVLERKPVNRKLSLSEGFLSDIARPLATQVGVEADSDLAAFQRVNREIRAENEATIRETLSHSSPVPLWSGPFRQLPGSKVMSRFAEYRVYDFEGQPVSEARHYGYDLASTSNAIVGAAASGKVLHAGPLGIYGETVLIDHGLGLGSLYGHLSQIDVSVGDELERDTPIGRSGATGLAGGDHLHFAVQVSGQYVDPLDWWDGKWVRSHIETRLRPANP